MIKAVIFDMDGVIVDSEGLHQAALQKMLEVHGKKVAANYFQCFIGIHDKVILQQIKDELNIAESVEELLRQKEKYFFEQVKEKLKLFKGFRTFLTVVKEKNLRLAITSSSTRVYLNFVLEKFDLKHNFPIIISGEDIKHPKPDPEPYTKTIEQLKLKPEECMVIEDSIAGLRSAKAAGAHTIAVTNSFAAVNLSEADLVVNNLTEINANIIALFGVL